MKALKRILTVVSCLSLSVGLGLSVVSASTPETKFIDSVDVTAFEMYDGASIRLPDEDIGYGIRFCAGIAPATYQALEALETDTVKVNYGMVIVPADLLPEGGFTKDTLADENNHFTEEECDCGKVHYATVKYTTMASDDKTGLSVVRGSIVNIKDGNLMRPYVGIGYIEYVTANGTTYEIANGSAENARSMVYVAQLAIANGEDDANNTIYNTYVAPFADKEFGYTVNHFIPNEDGSYNETATKSEVLYGTLGEEVTATKLADYKIYSIDSSKGKVTDTLYANGKTVLNAYYVSMDTTFNTVVNNANYYLMGANKDLSGVTTTWHDSIALGGETKEGVIQIDTTEYNQYVAGRFKMAIPRTEFQNAVANDWAYIKLHMYIIADKKVSSINFLSKNEAVAVAETGKWVDVIVPLAKLNQYDTYLTGFNKNTSTYTKEEFLTYANMDGYGWDSATKDFLCTNSVKSTMTLDTYGLTYYIDEVSWGVDTTAPEITVSGIASQMNEGVWTEPTITVTDDLALQSRLESTIATKLYKVVDGERQEVALTDGSATLDKGSYVYVVTADDRIYTDVVGNVATKEVSFEVVEKQDIVITFNSLTNADGEDYIIKNSGREYAFSATYLNEEQLLAEIATVEQSTNANSSYNDNPEETITPVGGGIKVTGGMIPVYTQGAYFNINLSNEQLAQIGEATSFTIRMYAAIETGKVQSWDGKYGEADLLDGAVNGSNTLAGIYRYTWTDVTINVSDLAGTYLNYFNGTTSMFFVNSNFGINENSAVVAFYINSITFDVTP